MNERQIKEKHCKEFEALQSFSASVCLIVLHKRFSTRNEFVNNRVVMYSMTFVK